MRTPRTLISLLLVALMLVSAVVPFASFAEDTEEYKKLLPKGNDKNEQ